MTLFLGLIFGVIGSAYIVYGKRQHDPWFFVVGFALVLYPYFIPGVFLTILVGALLALLPVAKRKEWF